MDVYRGSLGQGLRERNLTALSHTRLVFVSVLATIGLVTVLP
jgi:hypothetical protein